MNILALDIGTKRIGVARSGFIKIATPVKIIHRTNLEDDLEEISKLVKTYSIDKILLGLPLTLEGKEEHSANYVKKMGKKIEEYTKIEVIYFDERFSSVSAEQVLIKANVSRQKRKKNVDKLAATIILQNYLDRLEISK